MKQALKNEAAMMDLINKIQTQLSLLDKKLDTLINRPVTEAKAPSTPSVVRSHDHNRERIMHKAICADCQKECTIPFKPSAERPVYCQDCFSRRKVISLSGIKVADKPQMTIPETQAKTKKKTATIKKSTGKKKAVPKKK